MTQSTADNPKEGTDDTMSKLVGALLLELANDVPDRLGMETVRADLFAASKVYETGKKKDLALRFYLAIRSLLHELEHLEKAAGQGASHHEPVANENYPAPQHDGQYQN
jgi:hypothetical protein